MLPANYAVVPPFYSCIQDWPDDPGHHNISDGTDSDIAAYKCTAAQQTGLENWLNYR